jgi:flagellar hook-basal body complex protein FliE
MPISPIPPIPQLPPAPPAAAPATAPPSGGGSFASLLSGQIDNLSATQAQASVAAQQLATGQASDLNAAVNAVERARLAMELAVQVRGKLIDAENDIFHTQV